LLYTCQKYDDDVYLGKLQTRGLKKSIIYMWIVDYGQ
jgi:hypothetical protein